MRQKLSLKLGGLILISGVILGLVLAANFDFTEQSQSHPQVTPKRNVAIGFQEAVPEALLELQSTSDAFVYIAERVIPTVVTIRSTRVISSEEMERLHDRDDLRDFFRFRIPKEFRQQGSGSGIIVSEDGYILTNVHVVDKSENLQVTLSDNREFQAKIIGIDPLTEVAVVKVQASNLPTARLGDSDKSRVGEWVLAIGNPLELRSTVTAGIISAKDRQIDIMRDSFSVENFIQTDAAINPGNSGGALVNLRGEVIGINTAIATETGYSAGFGFAIPINLARKIMNDIITKGRVERGYIGIAMLNMDEEKARSLSLDRPRGVFVDRVLRDSPASKSGLRPQDVILRINDIEVNKSNQVQAVIAKKNPGDVVRLSIWRDGKPLEVKVTLEQRTDGSVELASNQSSQSYDNLGLAVQELTPALAKHLDYSGQAGVVVENVQNASPADQAGIRTGDVIVEIDEESIRNETDFQRILAAFEDGSVAVFKVMRGGDAFHIFVRIPAD